MTENPHQWRDEVADSLDIYTVRDGVRRIRGLAPKGVRPTVFLDTEFSGFGKVFSFLDVAAIKVSSTGMVDTYESKVYMDEYSARFANAKSLEIVGYDQHEWADAPPATEVLPRLYEFCLGSTLIGHNLEADVSRLVGWWTANGVPVPHTWCFPMIDTEVIARAFFPDLDSYTLAGLCTAFGVPPETQHRAMGGAERVRACWEKMIESA